MSHVIHSCSGVFEGIKCYKTDFGPSIFKLDQHIDRLFESAEIYKIKIPFSKQEIIKGCIDVVRENQLSDCYIRPIAFYGYDTLGVILKNVRLTFQLLRFFGAHI